MNRTVAVIIGAALVVTWCTAVARAGELEEGRALYVRLCASCHGVGGRGDGPVAPALGERPTDLTTLARNNGGVFAPIGVFSAIDGTTMPRAHGVSEMPVWGDILASPSGEEDPDAAAREAILLLTNYLRTIQRPTDATKPDGLPTSR